MLDVNRNPNIEVMAYSEVTKVDGFVGNFKVHVTKKPRYVLDDVCNACGACVDVCPIYVPNEFNFGFSPKKAIDILFPQAVPAVYTIEEENCVRCYACVDACEVYAIDFSQEPKEVVLDVGAIIVCPGWDMFESDRYGYGKYWNVINQIQLERILSASGPTEGHLLRPSDNKVPKKVLMINCVGARSEKEGEHTYCPGVCCLVTIKNAQLILSEYPDTEIIVSYRDIRAPGKAYEEYYRRAREKGIIFLKGMVGDVEEDPETKNLICYLEDEGTGQSIEYEADMVVLSSVPYPSKGVDEIADIMKLERSPDGFLKEFHARLDPVRTKIPGVFIAGFAQAPKPVDMTVNQGKGAASAAATLLVQGKYEIELIRAQCNHDICSVCGNCVEICPYDAITIENDKIVVSEIACRGCGACSTVCKNNAMTLRYFRNIQYEAMIEGLLQIV